MMAASTSIGGCKIAAHNEGWRSPLVLCPGPIVGAGLPGLLGMLGLGSLALAVA